MYVICKNTFISSADTDPLILCSCESTSSYSLGVILEQMLSHADLRDKWSLQNDTYKYVCSGFKHTS